MKSPLSARRSVWPAVFALLATTFAAGCERTSRVVSPADELTPQANNVTSLTNLEFRAFRQGDGTRVQYATISVYLDPDATTPPTVCSSGEVVIDRNCWLITDANGKANIQVPTGVGVAYLARVLPPEWLNFAGLVVPPLDPGTFTSVPNDLGALTCNTAGGPIGFTPGRFQQCLDNLYLIPTGTTKVVELALPVAQRCVSVLGLNGAPVTNGVYTYLVDELQQAFGWQSLPQGVKAGLLHFFGPAGSCVPGGGGFLEIYGEQDGFEIAGTQQVGAGTNPVTVETNPVICANGTQNIDYSITRAPTNTLFSFTDAKYAFAAARGNSAALDKDLTTTVLVLKFTQNGGPFTVSINQRHRTAAGTHTATASFNCTNGVCDIANALVNVPGSNNPMVPHLYHPKPGKLIWVVQGLNPAAVSEWAAKAQNGSSLIEQIPVSSKRDASSAFKVFSKGFTFCHPDFSFDGGWGCSI